MSAASIPGTCSRLLVFLAALPGLGACGDRTGQLCRDSGQVRSCGEELVQMCTRSTAEARLRWGDCQPAYTPDVTPLVLRFGEGPIELAPTVADGGPGFQVEPGNDCAHDWPTAGSPWLALDRNDNGRIDDGTELFGSGTELDSGEPAMNGFLALRELDANGDGIIDGDDPAFDTLQIWWDHDGDRDSDARELTALGGMGVEAISLHWWVEETCDDRGNCGRERAAFIYTPRDGVTRTGQVVDVHLACQG